MAERWHAIPIPLPGPGGSEPFEAGGRALLLCNADGGPYVIDEQCPHARQSLAGGHIEGSVIACPLHGGQLDLRDGKPVSMPIRRATTCYPVRADGDALEVALPD